MLIQVLVRLIVYIDQYISRSVSATATYFPTTNSSTGLEIRRGIDNTVSRVQGDTKSYGFHSTHATPDLIMLC